MNFDTANQILKENMALPDAKFGQNFLCDDIITNRIVELAGLKNGDNVLEIGPGIGAITRPISPLDVNLKCVEIDRRLVDILRDSDIDAEIISADYLKLRDYGAEKIDVVVSNLPYYIMTDIMKKIFSECTNSRTLVFMVEQAALERILAIPETKQYGPLSVLCSLYGDVKKEFVVPFSAFIPMPHTTSCVISLRRTSGRIDSGFEGFVEKCFSMRRKRLMKNLADYERTEVLEAFSKLDIDINCRAEELKPEQFLSLYELLNNLVLND